MSDMLDFCRIMSNTDNVENHIRIHPSDTNIKNEYEYNSILTFLVVRIRIIQISRHLNSSLIAIQWMHQAASEPT
jgi:hypothetical protein